MNHNMISYILVMAAVTFVIRALPLTLIRKPIKSRFLRSFLFYVPYVTLAVMTVPDILLATDSVWAGALALIAGTALAWSGGSLLLVAASASVVALIAGFIFK